LTQLAIKSLYPNLQVVSLSGSSPGKACDTESLPDSSVQSSSCREAGDESPEAKNLSESGVDVGIGEAGESDPS